MRIASFVERFQKQEEASGLIYTVRMRCQQMNCEWKTHILCWDFVRLKFLGQLVSANMFVTASIITKNVRIFLVFLSYNLQKK